MAKPLDEGRDETRRQRPRRAGLRPDERDPNEPPGPAGSAGGGENMSGTPGGGLAAGGLEGTNAPSGAVEGMTDELNDAFGDGTRDISGEEEIGGGPPYAGPSGGAVGGTPAEKRAEGGNIEPGEGIVPGSDHGGDSTIGSDPFARPGRTKKSPLARGDSGGAPRPTTPPGTTDTSQQ